MPFQCIFSDLTGECAWHWTWSTGVWRMKNELATHTKCFISLSIVSFVNAFFTLVNNWFFFYRYTQQNSQVNNVYAALKKTVLHFSCGKIWTFEKKTQIFTHRIGDKLQIVYGIYIRRFYIKRIQNYWFITIVAKQRAKKKIAKSMWSLVNN